ncbi:MAG: MotA/TolQ/ExbB proton channel family protein [Verrucomicrobia bacterium]|nr:MotA/TolQ/ExbB proton channel family protein [Verrucomicrobiota bacterium]
MKLCSFTGLFLLALPTATYAQETIPTPADPAAPADLSLLEIVSQGGIMMYPLALLSVAAVILIFLFFITIRRGTVVSDRFMRTAESLIRKRDYLGLVNYASRRGECVARITQKSLDFATKNSDAAFVEIREVAEAEGSRQAGILNQRITYLSDVGTIAPMVGLLGTVIGMIRSFLEISRGSFEGVRQMKLASGVSEALVTTAGGLVIGIIAMIFYSIFRGRVQRYISELEAASTHLLALMSSQFQRNTVIPPASAAVLPPEAYDIPRSQQPAPVRPNPDDHYGA